MPAAVAIPAAVSAGTSLFGAYTGAKGPKQAGQMQWQEARNQSDDLLSLLRSTNPQIREAADRAIRRGTETADFWGSEVFGAADRGAEEIRTGATRANELLDPYIAAGRGAVGQMAEFMGPGGEGMKTFTARDMEQYDPGYQFRLDKAAEAQAKSAAARGGLLGGGAAKALAREQQGLASSEFGAAYDRFMRGQESRFSRLATLTGQGLTASGQAGANITNAAGAAAGMGLRGREVAGGWNMGAANLAGNWDIGAANEMTRNALVTQGQVADLMTSGVGAKAAGKMGAANAWQQGLSGVGQAAMTVGSWAANKDLVNQIYGPNNSLYNNPAWQQGITPGMNQLPLGYRPNLKMLPGYGMQ